VLLRLFVFEFVEEPLCLFFNLFVYVQFCLEVVENLLNVFRRTGPRCFILCGLALGFFPWFPPPQVLNELTMIIWNSLLELVWES